MLTWLNQVSLNVSNASRNFEESVMPSSGPNPQPIYKTFGELFRRGFTIDWVTTLFIGITHVLCLLLTPVAYYFAPEGFWKVMLAWSLVHMLIGCISTTAYAHRLISHGAARQVSWPVHIIFGFFWSCTGYAGQCSSLGLDACGAP